MRTKSTLVRSSCAHLACMYARAHTHKRARAMRTSRQTDTHARAPYRKLVFDGIRPDKRVEIGQRLVELSQRWIGIRGDIAEIGEHLSPRDDVRNQSEMYTHNLLDSVSQNKTGRRRGEGNITADSRMLRR